MKSSDEKSHPDKRASGKKVVLVSYHFPPSIEVGGRRPSGLKKYMERRGWEVHIVTEDPSRYPQGAVPGLSNLKTIDGGGAATFRKFMQSLKGAVPGKAKIRGMWDLIGSIPDPLIGWALRAIPEARRILREQNIRMVYTSSPPQSAAFVGLVLKWLDPELFWVCELRDLWTSDIGYRYKDNPLRRRIDGFIERQFITRADKVVTVTGAFRKMMAKRYDVDVQVVYNGYDRDFYPNSKTRVRNDVFRVLYCGSLYTGERDPQPFLSAVEEGISNGDIHPDRIRVEFFVQRYDRGSLERAKGGMRHPQIVIIRDPVPYEEIARIQREVDCHLVINRNNLEEMGPIPAKLYEFIGTGLPILVWDPANSMSEDLYYLGQYNGLSIHTQRESLGKALVGLFQAWSDGKVSQNTATVDFSQEAMAEQIEAILENLIRRP